MAKNNPPSGAGAKPIIIVRRPKGHGHGHHGGSWKVAFADFMTAMMAFFLLLWLLESATPKELKAIAGYFQAPAGEKFEVGPGGSDASLLDLGAAMEVEPTMNTGEPSPLDSGGIIGDDNKPIAEETEAEEEEIPVDSEEAAAELFEQEQLEALEEQLQAEINNLDSALNVLKDQIHIEVTALGLSIQIVDKERRTMFSGGSAQLQSHALNALLELAPIIDKVPNRISIIGHTDAIPYSAGASYSNWELSADRANSARRALLAGDLPEAKVIAVQGMGSKAPMVAENPLDPINRRIAIIVLKNAVAEAMLRTDTTSANALPGYTPAAPDRPGRVMSEEEVDAAIEQERPPAK